MICTSYYSNPKGHRGLLYSISRSEPKGFHVDGKLDFFVPSKKLLQWWKKSDQSNSDWTEYTQRFRKELNSNSEQIFKWLQQFSKFGRVESPDITLLCWEKGDRCHRHLVRQFVIEQYAPLYNGGESPGELTEGLSVDWPWMPDYLVNYVNLPLIIRKINGDTCRLSQIDKNISLCFLRNHE